MAVYAGGQRLLTPEAAKANSTFGWPKTQSTRHRRVEMSELANGAVHARPAIGQEPMLSARGA